MGGGPGLGLGQEASEVGTHCPVSMTLKRPGPTGHASALARLTKALPPLWGKERERKRSREWLLKFLSGEINIEAISEQVFQLWAWRLSSIPRDGH